MPLPDTRAFTVPEDYLNAWCAAQPERDTYDQVALGPPTLGLPALLPDFERNRSSWAPSPREDIDADVIDLSAEGRKT